MALTPNFDLETAHRFFVSRRGDLPPFYLGYAYEALARAAALAGRQAEKEVYLRQAQGAAVQVTNEKERQQLLDDLATIA